MEKPWFLQENTVKCNESQRCGPATYERTVLSRVRNRGPSLSQDRLGNKKVRTESDNRDFNKNVYKSKAINRVY